MAKSSDSQRIDGQAADTAPRLFKSKDVHKRRVGHKAPLVSRANANKDDGVVEDTVSDGPIRTDDDAASSRPEVFTTSMADDSHSERSGAEVFNDSSYLDGSEMVGDAKESTSASRVEGAQDTGDVDRESPSDSAVGSDEHGSADGAEEPRKGKPDFRMSLKRIKPKQVLFVIITVLLIAVIGFTSAFAWNRWGRYDDHAEMQGGWYVMGTTVPISIDDASIHLSGDISYEYEINDHAKTISYTFGPMSGQGRYWFSDDRRFLAITDGEGYTDAGTAFEDLAQSFSSSAESHAGVGFALPEGDGVIVFCREPGLLATMAREASERGVARVKEQVKRDREEAERKAAEQEASELAAAEKAAEEAGSDTVDAGQYVTYVDDSSNYDEAVEPGYSADDDGEQIVEEYDEESTEEADDGE